jgi:hypothetical protein
MADNYLTLSREDRLEALGVAATSSGRPVHLLEKDIWVVWALGCSGGRTAAVISRRGLGLDPLRAAGLRATVADAVTMPANMIARLPAIAEGER